MPKAPQEIASADDGEIGGELLDWSGLSKMWQEQGLTRDYDFLRDVAEHCQCIDISAEQWSGDAPGLSDVHDHGRKNLLLIHTGCQPFNYWSFVKFTPLSVFAAHDAPRPLNGSLSAQ